MRLLLLLAGLLLALFSLAAEARMHAPYRGHRIVPQASAPLDTFATPAAAYSMRRLRSAYTGPALRLRRASDNLEQDINFLGFTGFTGAPIDTAAAQAHCAATTCTVATWYDQSGNSRNVTNGTPANQPAYTADCGGGLPCAQTTTAGQRLDSSSVTWAAAKTTLSVVGRRLTGTNSCYWAGKSNNLVAAWGGNANSWLVTDFVGEFGAAAADGAWHAGIAVIDAAASLLRVDGTETAGTMAGTASAGGAMLMWNSSGAVTCQEREAAIWDNYVLTPAERAALRSNQQAFWGTP